MKITKYIIPAFAALLLVSCFEDKSTDAIRPLAEIIIEDGCIKNEYNIAKNEELVIKPLIKQLNNELPLSYTWEIDQKVVSRDETFHYVGSKLGSYSARLIVENSDGKAFHIFKLNVNSPYENGITVLSKDAEGRSCLSFMQESMIAGEKSEFYNENSFEINNPDLVFASNASDIIQTKGSIIIACQGKDGDANDNATIYFLNEKTFVMENLVDGSEYPTFKPTKLLTPSESYEGGAYPVLSADGKMYSLPTYNAVLQPSHNLLSTYAQTGFVEADNSSNYDIIMWDKELNCLTLIYNGYGPYYCGKKYLLQRDAVTADEYYVKNFKPLKGVKTVVPIRRTAEQKKTKRRELIAIVQAPLMLQKVIVSTFFWEPVEGKPGEYNVLDNSGFVKAAKKNYSHITEQTPCIANATYKTMLFPIGNKIMKWYYSQMPTDDGDEEQEDQEDQENQEDQNQSTTDTDQVFFLEDAEALCEIGSAKAVITAMEISDDHKQTYVAFYEPEQEGKNGSVWVINTKDGTVLEKYDNVCYQPVKMIYKKK